MSQAKEQLAEREYKDRMARYNRKYGPNARTGVRYAHPKVRIVKQPDQKDPFINAELEIRKGTDKISILVRVNPKKKPDSKDCAEYSQIEYLEYLYRKRKPSQTLDTAIKKLFRKLDTESWPSKLDLDAKIEQLMKCPIREENEKLSAAPIEFAIEPTSKTIKKQMWSEKQKQFFRDLLRDRFVSQNGNAELLLLIGRYRRHRDLTRIEADKATRLLKKCDFK